jgi:hypothetical protein
MRTDNRVTPVVRFARRTVAGKDWREAMACPGRYVKRSEITTGAAEFFGLFKHGQTAYQAAAVNGAF